MSSIPAKKIELFCGTGGVGKTTLSASRALYLASQDKKVLLITIDPARRLKEILNLQEENSGNIETIPSSFFTGFADDKEFSFDALLMSPAKTLARMGERHDTTQGFDNPIIKILTRPHGGMNEILAIIEVQQQLQENIYDCIILDTPPGKHFIDFLQGTEKIRQFFDKSFIDIFKFLGKPVKQEQTSRGFLSLLIKSGVKKLLSFLEKVTGKNFVDSFIDAIIALYNNKDSFLTAISFQNQLKEKTFSNWFLVTSVEQQKTGEAEDMQKTASRLMHDDNFMAINKSLSPYLKSWNTDHATPFLKELKTSMLSREAILLEYAKNNFENTIDFPEILDNSPGVHVVELAKRWSQLNDQQ